ncbi:acyl-CoA dehydrogenase family protein [Streptomyces sp. NPDC015346]|uniref:acyl-CoA dehydrogenase family protein n=1 Tax=Streptomyces sp. NPDC015346 TaxID=3364954 RepID=UPI0036FB17B2
MRFRLTDEQRDFGRSLNALLTAADTPAAVRSWGAGDPGPGLALWARLAEAGVFALAVPEAYEGVGAGPVELAVAFTELGRHAVPGPVVETVAASALLTELARRGEVAPAKRLLPGIASGETVTTLAMPPGTALPGRGPSSRGAMGVPPDGVRERVGTTDGALAGPRLPVPAVPTRAAPSRDAYALDADVAGLTLVVVGDELRIARGHGPVRVSADPARRFARPDGGGELLAAGPAVVAAAAHAAGWAMLATAAQSLGVGLTLLDRTVAYARQRTQFGTAIGSFQAVKHRLADTLIGLEFARPLLFGAALTFESTDLAAAKVSAGEAAWAAARTALQIHGAVGYTEELDLSLWLRKARPLRDAWGTPSWCRAQVLGAS